MNLVLLDQSQMRTRGEGVKKSQNFADVIYGWPPTPHPHELGRSRQDSLLGHCKTETLSPKVSLAFNEHTHVTFCSRRPRRRGNDDPDPSPGRPRHPEGAQPAGLSDRGALSRNRLRRAQRDGHERQRVKAKAREERRGQRRRGGHRRGPPRRQAHNQVCQRMPPQGEPLTNQDPKPKNISLNEHLPRPKNLQFRTRQGTGEISIGRI